MRGYICLSLILLLIASCDRPDCRSANPVFDRFAPDAPEYRAELARQIRRIGPGKLRYWYDGYTSRGGDEFIVTHIQGGGLCAKGELLVTEWSGIEGLRGSDPNGYRGAGLQGLKMDISESPEGVTFIFKSLDHISD